METVRLTLLNGEDLTVEHNTKDKPFDEVMQFHDASHVIKAKNGTRVPIRSILTYQIMEEVVAQNG